MRMNSPPTTIRTCMRISTSTRGSTQNSRMAVAEPMLVTAAVRARTAIGVRVALSSLLLLVAQLPVDAGAAPAAPAVAPTHPSTGEDRHPPAIDWATLEPPEQHVLAPLREQWPRLL